MVANHVRLSGGRAEPASPLVSVCDVHTFHEVGPAGMILVLYVAGEIDLLTGPMVRSALSAARRQAPRHIVVDLADVRFCCVRGFEMLADTAHRARRAGIGLSLSGLSTHFERVMTMLWPEEYFVHHGTAMDAVSALRNGPDGRLA